MQYLPTSVDPQFMVRFLQNRMTQEEKEFFLRWLEDSDAHKEEFAAASLVWDRMGQAAVPPIPEPAPLWERIREQIDPEARRASHTAVGSTAVKTEHLRVPPPPPAYRGFVSIAHQLFRHATPYVIAMLLFAMGGGILILASRQPRTPVQRQADAPEVMKDVVTRRGERVSVHLSDGSIVFLNAGSRLRFPRVFSGGVREVELEGEGFFAVQGTPACPFRVQTGSAVTEVKGTEFNVKFRGKEVEVVVAKGAVQVFDRRRSVRIGLVRGEASIYRDSTGFSRPRRVDVRRCLAWRENKLSFDKTPLSEVFSELELFYDVRVVVKHDSALHRTLTGYFASDSLDEVLSTIALAMDMRISRSGQTVTVY